MAKAGRFGGRTCGDKRRVRGTRSRTGESMNDGRRDVEETEGRIWRQVLIALAGSLGLAVVCCGGGLALEGARDSVEGGVGEFLASYRPGGRGGFGIVVVLCVV